MTLHPIRAMRRRCHERWLRRVDPLMPGEDPRGIVNGGNW